MYTLFTVLAALASVQAQDVYTARLMQDGKCLAPDSPTFNSPVNFQDCNKNPYQWWEVRGTTIHLGNTGFCLSAGRSKYPQPLESSLTTDPRHRCTGTIKPGAKMYLIGCPRDGTEMLCESWTFKDGHLHNTQNNNMCVAGGAFPTAQTCSNDCDQVWTHS